MPEVSNPIVDEDPSSTVLDLTSFQLHNLSSIELAPILTELDLTANRSLDHRIGFLSSLKNLSFRYDLIEDSSVEPLSRWVALKGLEELALRDNELRRIPNEMENLQNLKILAELWLGQNLVKTINLCGLNLSRRLVCKAIV